MASVAEAPNTIQVHATSPWQTLEDLAADAKSRPGKITWAIGGIGGTTHFSHCRRDRWAGDGRSVSWSISRRRGAPGGLSRQAGGRSHRTIGEGWDFYQEGTVRYLAVTGDRRVNVTARYCPPSASWALMPSG